MSSSDSLSDGLSLFATAIPVVVRTTLGIGIIYGALAAGGILLARSPDLILGPWVANAVALTFLLRQERRQWGGSFAGIAAGGMAAGIALGIPAGAVIGCMLANLLEMAVALVVIRQLYDRGFRFDSSLTAYINVQLAAAILAPALGGALGAFIASGLSGMDYGAAWWMLWSAHAMGALVILPVTLSVSRAWLRQTFTGRGLVEFTLLAVGAVGLIAVAVTQSSHPFVIVGLTLAVVGMRLNPFATACIALLGFLTVTGAGLFGAAIAADPSAAWMSALLRFLTALAVVMPFGISLLIEQLKREKASAEASEERFRSVMEGAAIGMGLIDANGNWITANRSLSAILGYSEAELRSLTFLDLTCPEDRVASADLAMRLFSGEAESVRIEKRYIRKDGAIVWALVASSVVRDTGTGDVLYIISQLEDITEKKAAEAALAASESRWNFALEGAGHGVWDVDLRTGKAFHSPVWLAMLGYAGDEVGEGDLGLWIDLVHPDDRKRVEAMEDEFMDGRREIFECEFRVRHKDGHYIWVLDRGRIVEWSPGGKPLRKIGTYIDITEKRRQAEALAKAESRWSFALESARQGVWDFDVRKGVSYYSPMWKALLGYSDDEIQIDDTQFWLTMVHPDDLPAVREANRRHMSGESPHFECEFRMRHKYGYWVWILDRGRVIERDADGAPLRMIGTHTDISAQKRAEERITSLSRRLQLAAGAGQIGLWELDVDSREVWWDEEAFGAFGASPNRSVPDTFFRRMVHPQDLPRVDAEIQKTIDTTAPLDTQFRVIAPNGALHYVRIKGELLNDRENRRRVIAGVNWDVTEHHRLAEALVEEKERLRVTLMSIGDAVICTDIESRITFINPAAARETGFEAAEAIGRPVAEIFQVVDEATGDPLPSPVAICLERHESVSRTNGTVLVSRDGTRRDIRETVTPVRTTPGEVIGAVLVFQDMTGTRQMQRELAYSAAHDGLTGLLNRVSFERKLAEACDETMDEPRHVLFFIDLDRFKAVNDTAGHAAGDSLLPEIAKLLKASVRSHDVTARIGGDEFGLLLYNCPLPQARAIAGKLVEAIQTLDFCFEGIRFDLGASIGIHEIMPGASPIAALKDADRACYRAKSLGRNRVCLSDEDEAVGETAIAS